MSEDRNERLQQLKAQALRTLQTLPQRTEAQVSTGDAHKLLEDLRIYQIELELQNEELQLAQQQAALASSRHQLMFDRLPVPAFVVDRHGLIHQSNDVATQWLGPSRSTGMQDFRLAHGLRRADRPRFLTALADAQGTTPEHVQGLTLTDVDGTARLIDVQVMKLPQNFHVDPRYNVLLLDRSAEAAREADRQLFQTILDSSDDLIYATDATGRCLLANQATLALIGLSHEQVLGRRRDAVLPLREAILQDASDHKVLHTGKALSSHDELHAAGQSEPRVFTTRKFPLRDARGQVWGVGGISRDITLEQQAQHHLRWSELAFQQTAQAVIVTDANTRIVRVNPGFCRMSGFSESTVLGQRTSILRSGRQDVNFYRDMWDALIGQGTWAGEMTNRTADGRFYTVWAHIDALRTELGELLGYVALQTNLTDVQKSQSVHERMASTDPLTGLPNRSRLEDRLGQLLTFSKRQRSPFVVMFGDLDRFKQVNDALGHQAGDQLLKTVAERLQGSLRAQDTAARMGGDEFVMLLPATGREDALLLGEKLLANVAMPIALPGQDSYSARMSLGLAVYPDDGETADDLVHNADTAMYAAKMAGRHRICTYSREMQAEHAKAFAIEADLHQALTQGELKVYLQPRFSLSDLKVVGAEALLRWDRPEHGLCEPNEFLAVAQKSGLIRELDAWVLQQVAVLLRRWSAQNRWPADWRISVNQAAHSLSHPQHAQRLAQMLDELEVPAAMLALELTEPALLQPATELLDNLNALQRLGVTLIVDDFGTGYSSLSHLQSLPLYALKIHERFVQDMEVNEDDRVLVEAMVELGHKLGHALIAEGVETEHQRQWLATLGCETGQGHLLQPPLPPADFANLYLKHT